MQICKVRIFVFNFCRVLNLRSKNLSSMFQSVKNVGRNLERANFRFIAAEISWMTK